MILNYRLEIFPKNSDPWGSRLWHEACRGGGGVPTSAWEMEVVFPRHFYADLSDFFLGVSGPIALWASESSKKMIPSKEWGWCDWRKSLLACNYRKHVLNWTKSSPPIFRRSDFSMLGFGRGVSMPAQRFTASSHWFQHDFGWAQEQFCGLEMFMRSLKNTTQMFEKQIIIIEIHGNFQVTWGWKQTACYLVVFFTYRQLSRIFADAFPQSLTDLREELRIGRQVESWRILLFRKGIYT